ncbi:zinc transporter ZntB [Plesiomonas shigelloides]|uniref:zinc transporter ZntB n=1 Tax=Plesiomonas shigelloides TaxID=703 RepID=UPI001C5A954B|nr:zinc transporter ZntB [Plesiomonas shigelloides]MBW3794484.1 zinc transporter ZntB [Plesiomonas shigelloides]
MQVNDVRVKSAISALWLDGQGGALPITQFSKDNTAPENDIKQRAVNGPVWLHLDYSQPNSADWIRDTPLLPEMVKEALLGESTRPRFTRLGEGVLITLRSINYNNDQRPDQMVALRAFVTRNLIVSSRRRRLLSVEALETELLQGNGPNNSSEWVVEVCDCMTDYASEFIDDLHEVIIELEDGLLEHKIPDRGRLALIRKQLIVLRRYLSPQRDVYSRLAAEKISWFDDDDKRRMQEVSERLGRTLDDLDAAISRTSVLADEIANLLADAMNRRTYAMSLLAMMFLPISFLTGLFGVNLEGIPGKGFTGSFPLFCLALVSLAGGIGFWLKRKRWL